MIWDACTHDLFIWLNVLESDIYQAIAHINSDSQLLLKNTESPNDNGLEFPHATVSWNSALAVVFSLESWLILQV